MSGKTPQNSKRIDSKRAEHNIINPVKIAKFVKTASGGKYVVKAEPNKST